MTAIFRRFGSFLQCIDKASERRMPSLLGKNEDRSGIFLDLPTKNDRMSRKNW
jgi:hypothetical protein